MKNKGIPMMLVVTQLMLLCITSCVDRFEMNLPLAVSSHNLKFGAEAGSTHILVYSTSEWQIFFDKNINWGALDRQSGEGNSEFVFSYSDNHGISRSVNLVLASGALKDTIRLYQAGELFEPLLLFTTPVLALDGKQETVTTGLSTDLLYNIDDITASVKYVDSEGIEMEDTSPWIENIHISETEVTYDVMENNSSEQRKAELILSVTDADGAQTIAIQQIIQEYK